MRACNCARASPFQSRTRVGCDTCFVPLLGIHGKFQSTHPRGVRPINADVVYRAEIVSIHAPAWGATGAWPDRGPVGPVSIHAPAWGATRCNWPSAWVLRKFQSTHPRGVRHSAHHGACIDKQVSIHAPAWGATSWARTPSCWALLFQSTHPRGVRRRPHGSGLASGGFNPRTRVGCDRGVTKMVEPVGLVSIHAPAWGATSLQQQLGLDKTVSIHAPAWGATSAKMSEMRDKVMFQSTHPRGVRRLPAGRHESPDRFQSTHPRGVRPCVLFEQTKASRVSIHAPAWGATRRRPRASISVPVSIHAPAWGATPTSKWRPCCPACFNPRTRVGCDLAISNINYRLDVFQSTHPRGVRRRLARTTWPRRRFQSTHPRGVRLRTAKKHLPSLFCFNPRTRVGCDLIVLRHMFASYCFNPRTRVGCDEQQYQATLSKTNVSIHAPAWGATRGWMWRRSTLGSFQSTHPRGVRPRWPCNTAMIRWFQSTHPRGVRRQRRHRSGHQAGVSIHAPAWGATRGPPADPVARAVSIHAPAWGATVSMFYPVDSRD